MFLTRNPYRLWSFRLGVENMTKIGFFSENTVFCVTKLNHTVLHHFPGARMLIWLLSCSLTLICTKVWELWTGNLCVNKKYGAPNSKCSASLETKRVFANNVVFYVIKHTRKPNIWHLGVSSHGNECPGATWGRKLPWKWVYRGHLRRKR